MAKSFSCFFLTLLLCQQCIDAPIVFIWPGNVRGWGCTRPEMFANVIMMVQTTVCGLDTIQNFFHAVAHSVPMTPCFFHNITLVPAMYWCTSLSTVSEVRGEDLALDKTCDVCQCNYGQARNNPYPVMDSYTLKSWSDIHTVQQIITHGIFSCDQAALQMVFSVCLSVCLSVCHTFLTMFPSSYHHEIFRSYYQWQK